MKERDFFIVCRARGFAIETSGFAIVSAGRVWYNDSMDTVFVKDVIRRLALIVALILLAIACCTVAAGVFVRAEEQGDDGYDLWLRYGQIGNGEYLAAAQSALIRLADKTQLTAAYDEWKDFSADGYTQESADAFRSALQNAKAVLDDADATQEEIDAALAALQAAHGALALSDTAEKTQGGCSGSAAGASLLFAAMLIVPAAIVARRKNKRNVQ